MDKQLEMTAFLNKAASLWHKMHSAPRPYNTFGNGFLAEAEAAWFAQKPSESPDPYDR